MCFFSDARVRGWFLLDSYLPTFFLTGAYLLCIWLGNKFMKDRPPFSLRAHLIVYNLGITLLSLYMLIEVSVLPCSTAEKGELYTVFRRNTSATDSFARKFNINSKGNLEIKSFSNWTVPSLSLDLGTF